MKKYLSQLLPAIQHEILALDGKTSISDKEVSNVPVTSLVFDSRKVSRGSLFFAWPGVHSDGNTYIKNAIEKGATVIVYQGELTSSQKEECAKALIKRQIEIETETGLDAVTSSSEDEAFSLKKTLVPVFVKVKDSRRAMAPVASAFYDNPSSRLVVLGVTGTEGKSSTVSFIWQLLRKCGQKAGFISTVEYSWGDDALPNPEHQTTPEAPLIQMHLAIMLENGCKYAVVEASSHGLSASLNRLGCVQFDTGVFMNVTLEHLEFHKNFENYRNDKANLFRMLDKCDHIKTIAGEKVHVPSIGIVNLEDPSAEYFINATKKQVYGFTTNGEAGKLASEKGENAVSLPKIPENLRYMTGKNIASARYGLEFTVDADGESAAYPENFDPVIPRKHTTFTVKSPFPGAFNAYNLMAAITAVSSVLGMPFEEVASKVSELKPVKGRMTLIEKKQPFELIVDYAHTPSSFETIFPPLRKRCSGRLFCLFGSGGERDLTKRPLQGAVAAKYCDIVFLSDEDPRGEDPETLLRDIAKGAIQEGKKEGENLFIIPDRKKAIRSLFKMAQKGDIVLLLGKSHENSIIYKDYVMPYDEISEAEKALSEMGYQG